MIWNQQNQVQLHQPSYSPHQIASMAKDRLVEFLVVQTTSSASSSNDMDSLETIVGCDKDKFDGAIFSREHKSGIGVVLKENQGSLLASLSRQLS